MSSMEIRTKTEHGDAEDHLNSKQKALLRELDDLLDFHIRTGVDTALRAYAAAKMPVDQSYEVLLNAQVNVFSKYLAYAITYLPRDHHEEMLERLPFSVGLYLKRQKERNEFLPVDAFIKRG